MLFFEWSFLSNFNSKNMSLGLKNFNSMPDCCHHTTITRSSSRLKWWFNVSLWSWMHFQGFFYVLMVFAAHVALHVFQENTLNTLIMHCVDLLTFSNTNICSLAINSSPKHNSPSFTSFAWCTCQDMFAKTDTSGKQPIAISQGTVVWLSGTSWQSRNNNPSPVLILTAETTS